MRRILTLNQTNIHARLSATSNLKLAIKPIENTHISARRHILIEQRVITRRRLPVSIQEPKHRATQRRLLTARIRLTSTRVSVRRSISRRTNSRSRNQRRRIRRNHQHVFRLVVVDAPRHRQPMRRRINSSRTLAIRLLVNHKHLNLVHAHIGGARKHLKNVHVTDKTVRAALRPRQRRARHARRLRQRARVEIRQRFLACLRPVSRHIRLSEPARKRLAALHRETSLMNRRVNLPLHVTLRQRLVHPQVSTKAHGDSGQHGKRHPRDRARATLTVLPPIQRANAPLTVNEPANIRQVSASLRALTRHPTQATTLTWRQHNRRSVRNAVSDIKTVRPNGGTLSDRKPVRSPYGRVIGDNITVAHALHVARRAQTATQTHQQTPSQTNTPTQKEHKRNQYKTIANKRALPA